MSHCEGHTRREAGPENHGSWTVQESRVATDSSGGDPAFLFFRAAAARNKQTVEGQASRGHRNFISYGGMINEPETQNPGGGGRDGRGRRCAGGDLYGWLEHHVGRRRRHRRRGEF